MRIEKSDFRLQPVLNYKSGMVDVLETEFSARKRSYQVEMEKLTALSQVVSDELAGLLGELQAANIDCNAIQRRQYYLEALYEEVDRQLENVEAAHQKMEATREELIEMMQGEKSLEKLREHHVARRHRQELQREMRATDEIVTTRYRRREP